MKLAMSSGFDVKDRPEDESKDQTNKRGE